MLVVVAELPDRALEDAEHAAHHQEETDDAEEVARRARAVREAGSERLAVRVADEEDPQDGEDEEDGLAGRAEALGHVEALLGLLGRHALRLGVHGPDHERAAGDDEGAGVSCEQGWRSAAACRSDQMRDNGTERSRSTFRHSGPGAQ